MDHLSHPLVSSLILSLRLIVFLATNVSSIYILFSYLALTLY